MCQSAQWISGIRRFLEVHGAFRLCLSRRGVQVRVRLTYPSQAEEGEIDGSEDAQVWHHIPTWGMENISYCLIWSSQSSNTS
jgi:hypothetical protein